MNPQQRQQLWRRIVAQVTTELAVLPATERRWLEQQLQQIADLQERLHALFVLARGEELCRDCRGECCGHGSFHFNLANLLGYLVRDVPLLTPDFSASCPYLGGEGCQMPPGLRPFNCVTFICESIENRLDAGQQQQFYALEQQLRQAYLAFDARYQGSSLRGLLQDGARLAGKAFLQRP
jgi:hypothetical protein